MAILIGTIAGGRFVAGSSEMGLVSTAVIVLALISWAFASRIPMTAASAPELRVTANPWTSTLHLLKALWAERRLWDGMVIVSWFWLVGAVVLSLLPALIKDGVGGTEGVVTLCVAVFAIGIAAGSLFAAQLSHVRPNLALVPIGAIVMGIVGLDLALAIGTTVGGHDISPSGFLGSVAGFHMIADFALFAFGGGLFVVPAFAAVQAWSAPSERARIIAAGNVLQAAFMVAGSLGVAVLQAMGMPIAWIFFGLALASFGALWFVLEQVGQGGRARFRRAAVPRAVSHRGARPGKPAAGRHPHADRAQPCQPDRRPAACMPSCRSRRASPSIPGSPRPGGPSRSSS